MAILTEEQVEANRRETRELDRTGLIDGCPVCGHATANYEKHPCRFEAACSCWIGIPCQHAN